MSDPTALSSALSETLVHEITKALALPPIGPVRAVVAGLAGKAIRRFASLAAELDHVVGQAGLPGGARWLLPRFVKDHSAQGVENIPGTGPLVIASNHPAGIDSVVISAHVPRQDYKIIIGEIPFFKSLPNIRRNSIFAPDPDDTMGRMQVIRDVIRHLRNEGAILIFPRGTIEADPDWMPNPDAEFERWSRSLEIFLKQVPETQVLITMVSGVISPAAMHHPLTRFRQARPDRQRLAFMYQMIRQMITGRETFGLCPRVTFGDLIGPTAIPGREHLLQTITHAAHNTLKTHMTPRLSGGLRQV